LDKFIDQIVRNKYLIFKIRSHKNIILLQDCLIVLTSSESLPEIKSLTLFTLLFKNIQAITALADVMMSDLWAMTSHVTLLPSQTATEKHAVLQSRELLWLYNSM